MNLQEKIDKLKEYQKKYRAYEHALGLMQYDAATGMPDGASDTLSDTMGILSVEQYNLTTDKGFMEIVKDLASVKDQLDLQTRREVEEIFEDQQKLERVPAEMVSALQMAMNDGNHYWKIAKDNNDFETFKPYLENLINLKKEYARCIKPEETNIYNTLLDEFEKGMTVEQLEPFFALLREKLVPLIKSINQCSLKPREDFLHQKFDIARQSELSDYVMDVMSVDKSRCTIKETEHPFTIEFSKNDVRITTKYLEDDLASNLYSVIHESGHALYELNVGDDLIHSVMGHGATTATHESQSRMWENNIGRSLPFVQLIFPRIKELFPDEMADVTAEDFYRGVNIAKPSLIRTDADELTYCMHIMVRYELEKKIFADELSVDELPSAWNRLYKEYLGIDVPDDTSGVLQDAHWAGGAFGYFPSYAVGNAYSAQIMAAVSKAVDITKCCENADFKPMLSWLTDKMYKFGMIYTSDEILQNVCGEKFDPDYYVRYLTEKFKALYNLESEEL
jgi:Zn-dependent carboxypeptidase